ncbi:phospholipase D-like domain-containing protein [Acinetobacter baumannii]|nr:phospholipase D-like domain-containing protein [Acinetobacter baumannii]
MINQKKNLKKINFKSKSSPVDKKNWSDKGSKTNSTQKVAKRIKEPTISVLVPFAYGEHIFRILPAKPWGPYEHFILNTLSEQPYSAQQLASLINLPYQLITEIMIPFMRVGWVELIEQSSEYYFKITETGINVSELEELPDIKDPQDKKRSFVIDPITGDCYRTEFRAKNRNNPSKQSFQVFGFDRVNKLLQRKSSYAAKLIVNKIISDANLQTIFNSVALDGEEVISFMQRPFDEPYGQDIRYAIAEVDINGEIGGMPDRLSNELKQQILNVANKQREKIKLLSNSDHIEVEELEIQPLKKSISNSIYISPDQYELILGGQQHKDHLLGLINNAYSKIIIHSTFIHPDKLNELMPLLLSAAKRSVQVDLMWGQLDPDETDQKAVQQYQQVIDTLEQCQKKAYDEGLESYFKIHLDASGSHTKFIICDSADGCYKATFGSCNWLASGFHKFEASVCISSLDFVAESFKIASILSKGKHFLASDFSQELARLGNKLRIDANNLQGNEKLINIQMVGANNHEDFLLRARDEAEKRIIICSHRVGQVADNSIFPTILSNDKASKTAIYGRATGKSGGMTKHQSLQLKADYESKGFNIVIADEPQIHAKILAWDDNDVLISSLNWLSASSLVDPLREIGIYINDSNIVDKVITAINKTLS